MENKKKNSVWIYLLLANGLTWLLWIPTLMIAQKNGYLLPSADQLVLLFQTGFKDSHPALVALVFSLAVYGPLVAGLVASWIESRTAGVADLVQRMLFWRVGWRWYLFIFILALLLGLIPMLIGIPTGIVKTPLQNVVKVLPYIFPLFLLQVLTSGIGEEPGWRGYLLPRLMERYDKDRPVWILGLIWAVWHYPFTIFWTLSVMVDVPLAAMVVTILSSLAGQTMSLIGLTYLYTWLYKKTGSIFLAIIFHALSNTMPVLFGIGKYPELSLVSGLLPWLFVLLLRKRLGEGVSSEAL